MILDVGACITLFSAGFGAWEKSMLLGTSVLRCTVPDELLLSSVCGDGEVFLG